VAIPRAIAAIAWVMGAMPLWFLARRVVTEDSVAARAVACTLYLFLPYGIIASRNFMPDALMTLATLCALLALMRYHEQPVTTRRVAAIGLVGLALLIKPMSVFLTILVLIGLHLARTRDRDVPGLMVMLGLCFVPPAIYYGYGTLFGTLVKDQMHTRFVPNLILSKFFWAGLLTQMQRVFTLPVLAIGWLGVVLAPRGRARVLLASLWVGYAMFAIAFTYHMPTHDYYHWPYIAVVALGVAAVVSWIEHALSSRSSRAFAAAMGLVCVAIALVGTRTAWPRLHVPSAEARLERYREIGALAEHDVRVLFLDLEYGYPLMYHSEVSGDAWPGQDDLAAEALGGAAPLDARARFERDYASFAPSFFIITDLESLDAQPDLKALLAERTIVVRQTRDYHVYKFVGTR
jgi:Dolichyl-phosphate-mannose-protein mannosyltransferase